MMFTRSRSVLDVAVACLRNIICWLGVGIERANRVSGRSSGRVLPKEHGHTSKHDNVITSRVNHKDDIYDSIKTFFSEGR